MAPATHLTLHPALTRELTSFLQRSGVRCDETALLKLAETVLALGRLTEEGLELFPELLVSGRVDDAMRAARLSHPVTLGQADTAGAGLARLLKEGAPLAGSHWILWLGLPKPGAEGNARFGLAQRAPAPFADSLSDVILDIGIDLESVSLRRVAPGVVRLYGGAGSMTASTSHRLDEDGLPDDCVSGLAQIATTEAPESHRTGAYLGRLLSEVVETGHGCLVVCVPDVQSFYEAFGEDPDSVVLDPPLSLVGHVINARDTDSLEGARQLAGAETLLAGMIDSDGITVITMSGDVLAYRLFVHSEDARKQPAGGARRRAFEYLKQTQLHKPIIAVLFRSSDGATELAVKE